MANLGFEFDPANVPPSEFGAIPAGEYRAMIVDSDMKNTKAGTGKYLELTHEILEGPQKGKKVWARLNLVNPNPTASQIAAQQLAEIVNAVGYVGRVQDSQVLHNRPCIIRVEYVPADLARGQKNDANEIKKWLSIGGGTAAATVGASPAPAAPAAGAAAQMPWAKQPAAA